MEEKWFVRTLIVAAAIGLFLILFSVANAAGTVCQIANGCVGTSTAPSYGQLLIGGKSGEFEFVASSTLGSSGAGTVTSVAASVPTGWAISGSPITTSGTLAFSYASGYGAVLTASSTNWNSAYNSWSTNGTNWTTAYTDRITSINNDTNVTGSIGSNALTLGWTGQLAISRGGTGESSFGTSNGIVAYNGSGLVNFSAFTLTSSLLTASNASTTDLTASGELVIPNGSSKGSTVAGQLELDTTNDQLKVGDGSATAVFDQRRFLTLTYSTTTSWSATTTLPLGTTPAALTLQNVQCYTDTGTLDVQFQYGSTPTYPAMLQASTTIGTFSWNASNTPSAGNTLKAAVGTPVSSPTTISCTATALVAGT